MLRRKLIAGNWKMNKTIREAGVFVRDFTVQISGYDWSETEALICPPFTALTALRELLESSPIKLGAQNSFWEEKGAYTGEISPAMLAEAGCSYVILGHSERRQIMGENNNVINRKLRAAQEAGLIPILCVGETLQERENCQAMEVVKIQLEKSLENFMPLDDKLVIAYEPVWAIGTGVNASSDDAQEMIAFIREELSKMYSPQQANWWRILYGGSVNADNIVELLKKDDIDGALIGGASLSANSLAHIVRLSIDV